MKELDGNASVSVDNSSDFTELLAPQKGRVAMYDLVDSINQDRDIKKHLYYIYL